MVGALTRLIAGRQADRLAVRALAQIRRALLLGSAVLLTVPAALPAQVVHATARVDSNNILIGDWLKLHIEISRPKDVAVQFPAINDSLHRFEIIRRDTLAARTSANQITEFTDLTIAAFDTGTLIIPPLEFRYKSPGDGAVQSVETQPIPVFVHSIAIDTTKDIKDIKPPLSVPISFAEILPYLLALAAAAALIWGVRYVLGKRKRGERLIPEPPPRPAHELALEALGSLESERLWQRGKVKEYHSQLTDIVRIYIERRFGAPAMEMITDDILRSAPIAALDKAAARELGELLTIADLVKFAKFQPAPTENEKSLRLAAAFVESTASAGAPAGAPEPDRRQAVEQVRA